MKNQIWKTYIRANGRLRDALSSAVFFCMLVGLDGGLRVVYRGVGITSVRSPIPWIFTLCWAALLTVLVRLLPRRGRRAAIGVLGGLFCLLFLTHAVLYKAKGTFFSFSTLMFAGDGLQFVEPAYFRLRILVWLLLLCGAAATVLAAVLVPPGQVRARGRRDWIVSAVLAVLCVAGVNLNRAKNLSAQVEISFDIHQASLLYEDFSSPNECVLLAGLYQYTFRDFCLSFGVYDLLGRVSSGETMDALDRWYAAKAPDPDNGWTGLCRGKNLLLIQLEAIDTWMVTEQFMPNLCRLMEEGVNFTQNYTPIYLDAGTFNTEMIVNTGLVSPFTGSTPSMYSRNAYPYSLPHLMAEAGYTVNSFHRSNGDIYNREEIHENWGYSHYYSGAEMGIPADRLDFDTELMRAYDTMTAGDPFFSFIITFSAHSPYAGGAVSAEYYGFAAGLLPEDTEELVIHAYAHAYETDLFLGALCDRLEEDGLLEDTVLVLYSDHYNGYVQDDGIIMERKNAPDKNMMTRTPFVIYEAHTSPAQVDKATSTVDILPTLVNLFGLDNDGTRYVGNDIFSGNGGYVMFADYSWYDGETYWNAMAGGTPTAEEAARGEELRRRLQMSWDTLRVNYFASRE